MRRALANPAYFHAVYIAPYDPNWARDDEGNTTAVPGFGQDMLRFAVRVERGVVMLPPEYLKTTLLSQSLPIWLTFRSAYFGTQLRGMLMSEEEGMAAANLSIVAWHIEHNERLLRDFCDDGGRPIVYPSPTENTWKEDALIVAREHPSRDPTWQAKGIDSKGVHGRRLDWFIGDDLVTPRNAESPTLRERAVRIFDMQVRTRLVAGAHALIAGNFNDPQDLLSQMSRRPRWEVFSRPSMHQPGRPDQPAKESQLATAPVLWPGNWTRDRLLTEYSEAPNRFRRIHLFDPRAEWGERLNVGWVTVIDPDETPLPYCKFFIGIDPASGGEDDDLDFLNITVGALHDRHMDVVQSLSVRTPTPRQGQLVGTMHDAFARVGMGVVAIGVSKQTLDAYFRGAVVTARPDLAHKIVPVSAPGSKELRLEGLGPYAQTKWIRVWRTAWEERTSDPADQHQELTMMEEWRDFPFGAHDDRLDGLDLTIRVAQEFAMVGEVTWAMTTAD